MELGYEFGRDLNVANCLVSASVKEGAQQQGVKAIVECHGVQACSGSMCLLYCIFIDRKFSYFYSLLL